MEKRREKESSSYPQSETLIFGNFQVIHEVIHIIHKLQCGQREYFPVCRTVKYL